MSGVVATGRPRKGKCQAEACGDPAHAKGLCHMHYSRVRRHGSLTPQKVVPRTRSTRVCEVPECDSKHWAKGYCSMHYYRVKRNGEPGPAERMDASGYGESIDGYRRIVHNGARVLEHRAIMEEHLGRPLLPDENVHHINGVRNDNRLENLELWSTSQPPGQRIEDKVAWAVELLKQYKPEALNERIAN